eukprot:9936635-Alexandrium_andersonii.AAC.1
MALKERATTRAHMLLNAPARASLPARKEERAPEAVIEVLRMAPAHVSWQRRKSSGRRAVAVLEGSGGAETVLAFGLE